MYCVLLISIKGLFMPNGKHLTIINQKPTTESKFKKEIYISKTFTKNLQPFSALIRVVYK